MDAGKAVHIRRGGLLPLVLQVPLMGIRQPGENARLYQDARRCSRSRGAQGQYPLFPIFVPPFPDRPACPALFLSYTMKRDFSTVLSVLNNSDKHSDKHERKDRQSKSTQRYLCSP